MLDYRRELVDRVQQKVAREEKKRIDILNQIDEIDRQVQVAFKDYHTMLEEGGLEPVVSQRFSHYVQRLKFQKGQHARQLAEQEKVLEKVRLELQQVLIQQKSLELLKEKEFKRYKQNIEKEEEKFLSEIALNRMYR